MISCVSNYPSDNINSSQMKGQTEAMAAADAFTIKSYQKNAKVSTMFYPFAFHSFATHKNKDESVVAVEQLIIKTITNYATSLSMGKSFGKCTLGGHSLSKYDIRVFEYVIILLD